MKNLYRVHKKFLWFLSVIVILSVLAVIFSQVLQTRQKAPPTQAPVPPPSPTPESGPVSLIQRTIPGETQQIDLERMIDLTKKVQIDERSTRYEFSSAIPQRNNAVILEEGTSVFERLLLPKDPSLKGYVLVSDYQNEYGQPERVVEGSQFYGDYMSTYIWASKGFSAIANPSTKEIYELHVFPPMSVDEYIQKYGTDILTREPEREILYDEGSYPSNMLGDTVEGEVQGEETDTSTQNFLRQKVRDNPKDFIYDTLCMFASFLPFTCAGSDLDDHAQGYTPDNPPPPGQQITPTPGAGLDYDIPFKDTSILPIPEGFADWRARLLKSWPSAKANYYIRYILPYARREGWNPAFLLALWTEETGASTTTIVESGGAGLGVSNEHIGCGPAVPKSMFEDLQCLTDFINRWNIQTFADFARAYCGPNVAPICSNNENFLRNLAYWYDQYVPEGSPGKRTPL